MEVAALEREARNRDECEQCGQKAPSSTAIEGEDIVSPGRKSLALQPCRDEEARKHEEHRHANVSAAAEARHEEVVAHHKQHRDATEAVERRSIAELPLRVSWDDGHL